MELIDSISGKNLLKNAPLALNKGRAVKNIFDYVRQKKLSEDISYPALVEHAASKYPHNAVIKYKDRSISYQAFNDQANQVARYLKDQGVQNGDVVALFMENRPEYLIYLTAISKLGAVAALINNSQRAHVLIHSLELVSAKAVIVGEEVMPALLEVICDVNIQLPPYLVPDEDHNWIEQNPEHTFCNIEELSKTFPTMNLSQTKFISSDAPCLYIYTSGTTGLPKASIQKHRKVGMITLGLGMLLSDVKESDTIYTCLPLYHGTALIFSWFTALANGASVAIRKKFSASEFWDDVIRHNATIFVYIGELCRYLLNQPTHPKETQHNLRVATGNGLRPDLWDEFKTRFQIDEVREFYGSSEGNVVCYNLLNQRQTMGFTLGSYAIVKVDTETEEPIRDSSGYLVKTKVGEPGLLIGRITKATPFEGYTDSSKNDSKIILNGFKQGDSWFNSGDIVKNLGFRHLQFVDRTGDTFRWKGENVSTGEVEMFVNQYPGVEEAITYGVEIPNTNGRAGMVAIRQKNNGESFDIKGLFEFLRKELPAYAIPVFVRTLSAIDATGTFKYQRNTLKKEAFRAQEFANQNDQVFVALPQSSEYVAIDEDILKGIEESRYMF